MEWIPFWLQDMRLAMDLLEDKELALYVRCCFEYVVDGTLPADGDLPKSVRACFNQTKQHIDNGIKKYEDRCETNRNNINRRWNKAKADDGSPPADGNQYDRIQSNTTVYGDEVSYTEREVERDVDIERERDGDVDGDAESAASSTPAPAPSFSDSTELAKKYLNDSGIAKVEALEDDIGKYGLEAVRSALKTAAEHDSRGGVTLAYYRKILQNQMSDVQAPTPKPIEPITKPDESVEHQNFLLPVAERVERMFDLFDTVDVNIPIYTRKREEVIVDELSDCVDSDYARRLWKEGAIFAAPGFVWFRSSDCCLYWNSKQNRSAWVNEVLDSHLENNHPSEKAQTLLDNEDKGWKVDWEYFIECASDEIDDAYSLSLTRDQCIAIVKEIKRTRKVPRTYGVDKNNQ